MKTKSTILKRIVSIGALPTVAAALISLASPAQAQITTVFSVDFNSPTYSDGPLVAGGADTTTPSATGWINNNNTTTNVFQVSNTATNGFVSVLPTGQDVRHLFDGAATVTSGSVFFDCDINVSAAQATGDYALHLGDGGTANFYARTFFKSSGAGFVLALNTSSGGSPAPTYGATVLDFNTPYHLLVRYDFVSGTLNDTGAIFINPVAVDGTGDTPYVTATTIGTDATTVGAFYLRQGSSTAGPTFTVDNVRVFTAVPEPGSALMGMLGATALLARRRRRA